MKIGSLFSGIGGFELAAERAGLDVAWSCEIDKQARQVLAHHWPDIPCYDDVTLMDGARVEPVDIITAGFPCQDLSVAGKREGLKGERSGLYWEIIRIVKEMRDATAGQYPALVLLENVPGLLSSHRGRDMATVLWGLQDSGATDVSWRVLDAQWYGVAQRRRRVFVVADLGGERGSEVLALSESLRGYPAPSRAAGEDVAGPLTKGASSSGGHRQDLDGTTYIPTVAPTLRSASASPAAHNKVNGTDRGALIGYRMQAFGQYEPDDTASALKARDYKDATDFVAHTLRADGFDASEDGTGRGTPLVPFRKSRRAQSVDDHETWVADEVANTLNTFDNGDVRTTEIIAFTSKDHGADVGEVAPTLRAMPHDESHANGGGQVAVAFGISNQPTPKYGEEVAPSLDAKAAGGGRMEAVAMFQQSSQAGKGTIGYVPNADVSLPVGTQTDRLMLHQQMAVRRLTPRECERLQGFPDDWTLVNNVKGKPMADGPRYRMIGNAVAVPVVEWILRRAAAVLRGEDLGGE